MNDENTMPCYKNSAEGNLLPNANKTEAKNQMPDNKNVTDSNDLSDDKNDQTQINCQPITNHTKTI